MILQITERKISMVQTVCRLTDPDCEKCNRYAGIVEILIDREILL